MKSIETVRLTFLGDIMITKEQLDIYQYGSNYDFYTPIQSIKKIVKKSDFVIANLETPIAGEKKGYTCEDYSFNTPNDILPALKTVGITMLQTANNHCLDRGTDGVFHTMKCIDKAGLQYIGTHKKAEPMYRIIEVRSSDNSLSDMRVKVGVLAATYGTNAFLNHHYLNKKNKFLVDLLQKQEASRWDERIVYSSSRNIFLRCLRFGLRHFDSRRFSTPVYELIQDNRKEKEKIKNEIEKCRKDGADCIVICLHIGGQYNEVPTEYTKETVDFCRRCGADVVIANHEHVIHPFEFDQKEDKSFFACYSMGNLLSSTGVCTEPMDKMSEYSVVYHLDLNKIDGKMRVFFQIFISHFNKVGIIVTEPVFDYLGKTEIKDAEKRIEEVQILLNRLYETKNIKYAMQEYYYAENREVSNAK